MAGSIKRRTDTQQASGWVSSRVLPADPPVSFTVDGELVDDFDPGTPWWLTAWASADWYRLALTAAPSLTARLWDPADELDLADLADLAIGISTTLTGRTWPATVRLAAQLAAEWPLIEAWAISHAHGLDLLAAPPRQVLAAVYAYLMAGCEKQQEAERLDQKLNNPIGMPGIITRRDGRRTAPWSREEEAAGFLAAAAAFGSPVKGASSGA